jgi:hypothetical protein
MDYTVNSYRRERLDATEMSEGEPKEIVIERAKQRVELGLADRVVVLDKNNDPCFQWPRTVRAVGS